MDHYEAQGEAACLDRDVLKAHLNACVGERGDKLGEPIAPKSIHLTIYNQCVLVPEYQGGLHAQMGIGESVFTKPPKEYLNSTPFTGLLLWRGDARIEAYAVTLPCDVSKIGKGHFVTATISHVDLLNALKTMQTTVSIGISADIVVVLLNESTHGIELQIIRRIDCDEDEEEDTCLSVLLSFAKPTPNVIRFPTPKTLSLIAAWGAMGKEITSTLFRVHRNAVESAAFVVFERDNLALGSKTYSYPCPTSRGVIVASDMEVIDDDDEPVVAAADSFEALVQRDAVDDPKLLHRPTKRLRSVGNAFHRVKENAKLPTVCTVKVSSKVLTNVFPSMVADKVHSAWLHLAQIGDVGLVVLAAPTTHGGLMVANFNGKID